MNHLCLIREMLSLLAPGAVFVNVGRGAIVDESPLADLARERYLRVATDVVTIEPLPKDSPLRDLPGLLYSPHIAGLTLDALFGSGNMALENLGHYLQGEPLQTEVTLEIYDRAS
ncbi:MAG: NAD(P)-dependent oxidoreductase [Chthoniobacterales bacterium]